MNTLPLSLSIPMVMEVTDVSYADDQFNAMMEFLTPIFQKTYPYISAYNLPLLHYVHMGYMQDDSDDGTEDDKELYVIYSPALIGKMCKAGDQEMWDVVLDHVQTRWGTDAPVSKKVYEATIIGVEDWDNVETGEEQYIRPSYKEYQAWVAKRSKDDIQEHLSSPKKMHSPKTRSI